MTARRLRLPLYLVATIAVTGCASSSPSAGGPAPTMYSGAEIPRPDPRLGLKAGWFDAGEAAWNMKLISNTPPSSAFMNPSTPGDARLKNSDLAFTGNYVIQGNYSGFQIWDIRKATAPTLVNAYVCPGSQSDVTVYGNLLFVSGESTAGRTDCGLQGIQEPISASRLRGIRFFDISDIRNPKYIHNVQTCRGSHTNTLATDPKDPDHVYIYVSGSAGVRSADELSGCSGGAMDADPQTALFRIEVIKVPLARPTEAKIVSSPRIFTDLEAPPRRGAPPAAAVANPNRRGGPTQCHDITTYPAIGLAGGACGGYGLLLDISDVANPKRIGAVADTNFSFWHSATFSNDGSKVLFTDEWGGGSAPRCRSSDRQEWGANALFTLENREMQFRSYYKIPGIQTDQENCVAHNGSLIPIPGREVMVQAWYQGGISIFDWTDIDHPVEIAFHDRGPMDSTKLVSAGSWSVYWYNGLIVSSEIARGLDIFELRPSVHLSQNEIDAAKTVRVTHLNAQEQQKMVWPNSYALARAYVDQLERSRGLNATRIESIRESLRVAEQSPLTVRSASLSQVANALEEDARSSSDMGKVHMLRTTVRALAILP